MNNFKVVASGIDTLVVNAYYTGRSGLPIKRDIDETLAVQLNEWKRAAQGTHDEYPTSLVFCGASLHMQPNGGGQGQWPWMLKTKDITLYISSGQWNGIASVRFNSDYLWSCRGLLTALANVQDLLDEVFHDEMYLQVSSVDLCADIAGWGDIEQLDRYQNFVTRARKRGVYAEPEWGYDSALQDYSLGRHNTGFVFGKDKKSTSAMSCRIYNKSREIKVSGKDWFPDLWASNGYRVEDGPVWRVEVPFKREALHELKQENVFYGVEDVYTLSDLLPVLWAYAVGQAGGGPDGLPDGWLRCVVSNGDRNRSRWPTHPAWQAVQTAFTQRVEVPEQFGKIVRKRREEHNIDKGIEAVVGYMTSLAAWVGGDLASDGVDVSVVLHWLAMKSEDYLKRVDRDFSAEIQRKRVKFSLQERLKGA